MNTVICPRRSAKIGTWQVGHPVDSGASRRA